MTQPEGFLKEPVAAVNKVAVVLNSLAGGNLRQSLSVQQRLGQLFTAAGLTVNIHRVIPARLPAVLQTLIETQVGMIIVGGGDGTLNTAARLLVDTDIVLGVLPLGTFNGFATDIGIPGDLEQAVEVLAQGKIITVDAGEINGRVFLNNVSVGVYPYAVRRRELYRRLLGMPKLYAMGYAALGAFWRLPTLKIWIDVDETQQFMETAFVFIGNNRYKNGLMPGVRRRPALNEGWLSVLYLRTVGRLALIKIVLRSVYRQLRDLPELEVKDAKQVTIETKKRRLRVALDGELTMLQPPLMLRIRPRVLRVIVPRAERAIQTIAPAI